MVYLIVGFCVIFVNELIGQLLGFKLGYLIVALLIGAIAKPLDASGKEKKQKKLDEQFQKDVEASGMSAFEYVKTRVPASVVEGCRKNAGNREALESYMENLKNSRVVTVEPYLTTLLEVYSVEKPNMVFYCPTCQNIVEAPGGEACYCHDCGQLRKELPVKFSDWFDLSEDAQINLLYN